MPLQMRTLWIGGRFSGLLVLGESHYGEPDDLDVTRQVIEEATDLRSSHAFLTKIEKVVTGEAARGRGPESFWQTSAFANFCPGAVDGPRIRPTREMWTEGYRLLPGLLTAVKPKRILVLGNSTWNNVGPLTNTIYISTAGAKREAGRLGPDAGPDGEGVPITSIRHPSSWGFNTMRWHAYYKDFVAAIPPVTD
ncbi:MAG: hypothetical protein ACRYG8_10230 [Janthinobacterium lividum]